MTKQVRCYEHGCNNLVADTVVHGTCDSCCAREKAMLAADTRLNDDYCDVHGMQPGEGAPCAGCEQAFHDQAVREAHAYIDSVVRGKDLRHINHRQRTPGQHIAYLCMTVGLYGATASQIIEIMRLKEIPGSTETVQAVLDYLK